LETRPLNYEFGGFTLDVAKGCVLKAGEEIKLRPKVYETLKYLVENSGRLIGKPELMKAVWPDAFVPTIRWCNAPSNSVAHRMIGASSCLRRCPAEATCLLLR
jgi:DNA-binding response OmpR family regulator